MKGYWFKVRAKQLLAEMAQHFLFVMDGLIGSKFSLRRSTNVAQKKADTNIRAIQGFHCGI